jgi:hypothetical protein
MTMVMMLMMLLQQPPQQLRTWLEFQHWSPIVTSDGSKRQLINLFRKCSNYTIRSEVFNMEIARIHKFRSYKSPFNTPGLQVQPREQASHGGPTDPFFVLQRWFCPGSPTESKCQSQHPTRAFRPLSEVSPRIRRRFAFEIHVELGCL